MAFNNGLERKTKKQFTSNSGRTYDTANWTDERWALQNRLEKKSPRGKYGQYPDIYSADNTNYSWFNDDLTRNDIVAGEDGVTEDNISFLRKLHRDTYNSERPPKIYDAQNKCWDCRLYSMDAFIETNDGDTETLIDESSDVERGVVEQEEKAETSRRLSAAMDKLTEKQRQVVVMYHVDGLTQQQIADRHTYLLERHLYMTFEELCHLRDDYHEKYGLENNSMIYSADDLTVFNTGLVTSLYQDIFAVFEPNANPIRGRKWRLIGFFTDTAFIMDEVPSPPKPLRYFAGDNGFHSDNPIRFNLDHILGAENLMRIPEPFRSSLTLPMLLKSCAVESMRRASIVPSIVVSQWFGGKKQYLLPLFLTNPRTAAVALTLEDKGGYYFAHTALTMEMAYCRARLLAKPEASWLADAIKKEAPHD